MITHNLIQGSPEWLAYRAQHFNASDAPAMLGCSPYKTRAQLLREVHTGLAAEVDIATQKRFDNGHRAEALARPLAEEFVGEELYPVTGSLGRLSASFDGLTMDERQGFEHKALNADLKTAFDLMLRDNFTEDVRDCQFLPMHHRVQMEQQLLVSGAERILFMASEWTADGALVEEQHVWYYPDEALRQQIVDGWAHFALDLAAYVLPAATEAAPVGQAPDALPALLIEVQGAVTASNLGEFKTTALAAIRSVNRTLATDQDFADAEKAVKWCADVESRIAAAKEHALSQTASIDALFKTLDDITAEAKRVRLDLDKLVTRRKTEVREEAILRARSALDAHIATLNAELAPMRLPAIAADFAGAIKGKRSLASMQDALDGLLATTKIAAEAEARAIRGNLAAFEVQAAGFEFLFADLATFVHKAADDFKRLVVSRISEHKHGEELKAKARADAEAKRAADEAQRKAAADALAAQQAAAPAPVAAPAAPAPAMRAPATVKESLTPRTNEPATLTLGAICGRLGFTVTAAFVADTLHVKPTREERGARYYTESQFATICRQLVSHCSAMGELYAGETA